MSAATVEITERMLSDVGGWQVLKEAKGLWEAGRVTGVSYEPPFVRGMVREGVKEYRAGLRIVTRTNVENLCTCRISRERGMVCGHSVAVALGTFKAAGPARGVGGEGTLGSGVGSSLLGEGSLSSGLGVGSSGMLPGRPVFLLHLEGSLNHLTARLQARYGEITVNAGTGEGGVTGLSYRDDAGRLRGRNAAAEAGALERLRAAGFAATNLAAKGAGGGGAGTELVMKGERGILRFLGGELPGLERSWKVEMGSRFSNINGDLARVEARLEVQGSGTDWFDLSVSLATGGEDGETFGSAEIYRLLEMGQNHVKLKSGRVALFDPHMLDELEAALRDCDPGQPRAGLYRVGRAHAGYLAGVMGSGAGVDAKGGLGVEWGKWTRQQNGEGIAPVPLGALEGVLRPYQKAGVYWLHFLARNGLGGILADEMGLGKTLQALAWLEGLMRPSRDGGGAGGGGIGAGGGALPSMVVCPSSLVQNWAREAGRFTPGMRVVVIEGADRHGRLGELVGADLAITSYPLLRRDIERYRGMEFRAVVLDEAQHIKNPDTQNAQAALELRALHRVVLTGTPLENSVRDIWSLMNFAMPGYLGSRDDFKERYEKPLAEGGGGAESATVRRRLAKRLRPFLLRRMKREVVPELPEKLEQVIYCDMTARQAEVYNKLREQTRRQVLDLAGDRNQGKARMLMLTALLRLRQACCDLRLLGLEGVKRADASAKLEVLDELVREAIDGGHRVLIFSQFVSMLGLMREALDGAGVGYCYLDGSTKERMREVDRFQADDGPPVFLISLKAGGVGLNLAAADTVVHFDPWWNPAVEAQATDRAHRIGQTQTVTAYKLIARGTVEEKILALQEKKRGLLEAIESEEPVMEGLTVAEIEELLG